MYKLIMLLLLVSCSVDRKEDAIKFAKDFCSCYGGLNSISFYSTTFNFKCGDQVSQGKYIAYHSLYYGDVCEKK